MVRMCVGAVGAVVVVEDTEEGVEQVSTKTRRQ